MKQLKILPLVAIISGVMVGCGGGSGGSGGGSAPSKTTFAFTFATPNLVSEASAEKNGCTVYDRRLDGNDSAQVLTYQPAVEGQLTGEKVVGFYSDKSGVRQGNYIYPTGQTLKFVLEDIPTDGYFTYQLLDSSNTVFTANSFSHDFLKDNYLRNATFSMNREAVSTCNQGSNFNDNLTRTDLQYEATEVGGNEYNFISQIAEESKPTYAIDSLIVRAVGSKKESTVLLQYADSEKTKLHQYGVRDWSNDLPLQLVGTGDSSPIINPDSFVYDELDINMLVGDYSYKVVNLSMAITEFNHPTKPKSETWSYSTSAKELINEWSVALNQKMYQGSVWDISIEPNTYYDLNDLPVTHYVSGSTIDTGFSFNEENEGFSRIAYRAESSSGSLHRVTHKIFTTLEGDVVVPELYYYSFSDQVKEELKASSTSDYSQSVILQPAESDISSYDFLSIFSHGEVTDLKKDHDGLVISEVELNRVSTHTKKSDFMLLNK